MHCKLQEKLHRVTGPLFMNITNRDAHTDPLLVLLVKCMVK